MATATAGDGWTVRANSPLVADLAFLGTSSPAGTARPTFGFTTAFLDQAPIAVQVTLDGGVLSLADFFNPRILNFSGRNWTDFTVDLVDANPTGPLPSGGHPLFAHFHGNGLAGWVDPTVTPFTTITGFNTTDNTSSGATLQGINELQLSGGVFPTGTQQQWANIGVHAFNSTGTFWLVFTPSAIPAVPLDLHYDAVQEALTNGQTLTGGAGNDLLYALGSNQILNADGGNDTLVASATGVGNVFNGGAGNDVYFVRNPGDLVNENAGEGTDTVFSTLSTYTLTPNVENLVLDGVQNIQGIGNDAPNVITGNDGDNTIIGGRGDDTVFAGGGNDRIIWNNGDNTDTVDGGAGVDTQEVNGSPAAGDTFTLAAAGGVAAFARTNLVPFGVNMTNVERLVVNGLGGDDSFTIGDLTGTSLAAGPITFDGGSGADTVNGANTLTPLILAGGDGNDNLTGGAAADTIDGGNDNDTIVGGRGDDIISGGAGDDTIIWNNGDNTDTVDGGAGVDTQEVNGSPAAGDAFTLVGIGGVAAFARTNLVPFGVNMTNVERLIVRGLGGDNTFAIGDLTGTSLAAGPVTYEGGPGIDIVNGGNTSTPLVLNGGDGSDGLTGGSAADIINGGNGFDLLDGRGGADTMAGGADDDWYVVDNPNDLVVETAGQGAFDRVFTGVSYALPTGADIEILSTTFNVGTDPINLTGNEVANTIYGNDGDNTIVGGRGDDLIFAGGGNDRIIWNNGDNTDTVDGGAGIDTQEVNGSPAAGDTFTLVAAGSVAAFARTNLIPFGVNMTNVERLIVRGLDGDDSFTIGDLTGTSLAAGPITFEGGNGADTVNGANTLTPLILSGGDGNDTLTGGAGADTIDGGNDNDTIVGGRGDDIIFGGAGDDRNIWNNGDNTDTFDGGAGIDTQEVNGSPAAGDAFTLVGIGGVAEFARTNLIPFGIHMTNVERLVVNGLGGDDSFAIGDLTGTSLAAGLVTFNGGAGADSVNGGNTAAALVLNGDDGADTLVGGAAADILNGGADDDLLDGRGGADTMTGGLGNDQYVVDNPNDVVVDTVGQGALDRVFTSVSYTLAPGNEIEIFSTTFHAGTDPINLTGNELANTIVGNDGDNIIDGAGGADTMIGRAGNDSYVVDNTNDVVVERPGEGTDRVFASVSYALGTGVAVETLSTTFNAGTEQINLTGNELANTVIGNDGTNILNGRDGNDTLVGRGGNDFFLFDTPPNSTTNFDTIADYTPAQDEFLLTQTAFPGLPAGVLAAAAFFTGTAAHDADDRIVYDSATGNLFFDPDGVGGAAQIKFAVVAPGLAMNEGEFRII